MPGDFFIPLQRKSRGGGWGGGPVITSGNIMAFLPACSTCSSKAYLPTLPQPFKRVPPAGDPSIQNTRLGRWLRG